MTEGGLLLSLIMFIVIFNLLLMLSSPTLCPKFEYYVNTTYEINETSQTGWLSFIGDMWDFLTNVRCDTHALAWWVDIMISTPVLFVILYLTVRLIRGGG
jgi:hypothetical protein